MVHLPIVGQRPRTRERPSEEPPGSRSRPSIAVWELTLACDQHCRTCGPRAGKARQDELTTQEALRLVGELDELGVGEVVLIGGEAYLRSDVFEVIASIRQCGMSCTLTTGGRGIDERRATALAKAGVQSVSVSIDGLEPHHDRLRGRSGSFRDAISALRALRGAGVQVACNTQLNRSTSNDLLPLLDVLTGEGIHAWQVQLTVAHGNAADHPDLLLQPYMLLELFETLSEVADRCRRRNIRLFPANSVGYFGPHEHKLRRSVTGRGHYAGCRAGIATIAIESHGMIKNCPSLGGPNNIGGSWRETSLAQLWRTSPQLLYMTRRGVGELWGYCRTCYYAELCRGGCTSVSEPLLGRPGNNPMCHHRALEMDRAGLRERLERVGRATGEAFDAARFRLIREPKDPVERERTGPVAIEDARTPRWSDPFGPGRPLPS